MGDISDLEAIVHISTAGMPKSQVDVVMGEQYNRKVLQSHEKNIENIWSQRLTQNPRLYNGSKFRLDSWKCENNSVLTLYLGLTCYRDYLATNWSPDVKRLHQIGKRDYGNQQAYMSDPLGVAAMVQTADDCFIFIRRSNNVGEAAGLWDVPGGHPEPEVC
ncbi:uridine diphosphate glucose pyrophosphatase NUDT22-like [Saccoglossus kowalevskii]|uniref:Nucleoside diphosphate-linked moiety X motif 22-like n=1 Tax=Saccoglossus kowalevskii TaxID=10224 RepID=A0ABM0MUR8_SACKO|nr:PREDICTED: nucleoside diphosphate-linked moiety X motif 22-like [Saccoglossus kowalevskii]